MFEDEYDLALDVMEGVDHRTQQGRDNTQHSVLSLIPANFW